jgi:WD40 repeat protein
LAKQAAKVRSGGASKEALKVWDMDTGKWIQTLHGHTFDIQRASFSRDGARVVTTSEDAVRVWDVDTGEEITAITSIRAGDFENAVFSPDGTRVITASDDAVQMWDAITGERVFIFILNQ